MARRPRIENAGYHHVYNRGVERRIVFSQTKDKEKFLEIVCEVSRYYDFVIHGYVIMDNHYHLLLENKRENLSAGMRQINATYAQYFNKKNKRVGHLWQDRFKSWYIFDDNYLFTLFKYLEFNPIEAKITKKVGEFRYTLIHDILHNKLRDCMKGSFALQWFDSTSELLKSLDIKMQQKELETIEQFHKKAVAFKKEPQKVIQNLNLKDYFTEELSKSKRDEQILKAVKDGFSGSEVARFLGLSASGVSRILKKSKVKP
jgi:REP element-mobilizing transposase RayT/DNA-binding CsgD family transcriptional regulator